MDRLARTGRAVSWLPLTALLISCGGGGGDASTESPTATAADAKSAKAAEFVPPLPVPADASVKGMWSGVYNWPIVSVHSVLLPRRPRDDLRVRPDRATDRTRELRRLGQQRRA